jgi:hypothetical protein
VRIALKKKLSDGTFAVDLDPLSTVGSAAERDRNLGVTGDEADEEGATAADAGAGD